MMPQLQPHSYRAQAAERRDHETRQEQRQALRAGCDRIGANRTMRVFLKTIYDTAGFSHALDTLRAWGG